MTENGKIRRVSSVTDIQWKRPLHEQLEPNLKGGPRSTTSPEELRTALRHGHSAIHGNMHRNTLTNCAMSEPALFYARNVHF